MSLLTDMIENWNRLRSPPAWRPRGRDVKLKINLKFRFRFALLKSIPFSLLQPMLPRLPTLLSLFLVSPLIIARDAQEGAACSVNNNKLQIGTYEFTSDCDPLTYCNPNTSKCEKKGCRRNEFPFGYPRGAKPPPRCEKGQFCPDEEDSCQNKLSVGSDCQLNRDGMMGST